MRATDINIFYGSIDFRTGAWIPNPHIPIERQVNMTTSEQGPSQPTIEEQIGWIECELKIWEDASIPDDCVEAQYNRSILASLKRLQAAERIAREQMQHENNMPEFTVWELRRIHTAIFGQHHD